MSKENKTAPSAKEATQVILEALKMTTAPEAILIEIYLETAFLSHRSEQIIEDGERATKIVRDILG